MLLLYSSLVFKVQLFSVLKSRFDGVFTFFKRYERQMDVEITLAAFNKTLPFLIRNFPVNKKIFWMSFQRFMNVHVVLKFHERYGRQMDVKTMLCSYWDLVLAVRKVF